MKQGRLGFEYEVVDEQAKVTAWGGLPLLVEGMTALGVDAAVSRHLRVLRGRREFDELKFVRSLVLLHAAGGDCLDDLKPLKDDQALCRLLGHALPSPETLRQFLYLFHEDRLIEAARENLPADRKAYVPEESEALKGLARVAVDLIAEVQHRWPQPLATVDFDATFQESHKKEAKYHYESGPGFQPMLATWAEQDLVVYDEFRDGNVPAHHDALGVAQRAFAAIPADVHRRLMRGDTASYSLPLLHWLCEQSIEFAIGAKVREGLKEKLHAVPEQDWRFLESRPESVLHVAEIPGYTPKDWRASDPKLRYIGIRLTAVQPDLFDEDASVRYLAVVTNRQLDVAELVRWYWAKGGTIEHVHDVLKNELGAGVLPCGRFGANAAWFRAAVLTYNMLRAVRAAGPEELRHARPKRLRLWMFAVPATLVTHSRRLMARIASSFVSTTRSALWNLAPDTG